MSKFKVGDEVRLKDNITSVYLNNNTVYAVDEVFYKKLRVHGVDFKYKDDVFDLVSTDFLSPLEAVEALLKGEELEVIMSKSEEWQPLDKHQNSVTIKNLKRWKFRLKPKTVIINGVEVVAPIDTKSLGYPNKVYGVNLSRKSVYDTTGHTNKGLFWATEEDAQKALDAMLLPFDKLNKGDK